MDFDTFCAAAKPKLFRAFVGLRGLDGAEEATAEALAYAWEHWQRLEEMDNPVGYLYRVGRSRTRHRRTLRLPLPGEIGLPEIEPRLVPCLLELGEKQRTAVWLVHGCGWTYAEAADAMGTSTSMIGNHVARGLTHLRRRLIGVPARD